jgi:hypothetical protein
MLPAVPMVLVGFARIRAWITFDRARWRRHGALVGALVAAAVMIVPTLWTTYSSVAFTGFFPKTDATYLAALRANEPVWSSPHTTLVELALPRGLIASWDAPKHRYQDDLLRLLDPTFTERPLAGRSIFIDDQGNPQPATLLPVEVSVPAPQSLRCLDPATPQRSLSVRFPRKVRLAPPVHVSLNLTAQEPTSIRVAGTLSAPAKALEITVIQPGTHVWIVRLDTGTLDGLKITALSGSGALCIHSAILERVALAAPDNTCRTVGTDGTPGGQLNCPPARAQRASAERSR